MSASHAFVNEERMAASSPPTFVLASLSNTSWPRPLSNAQGNVRSLHLERSELHLESIRALIA